MTASAAEINYLDITSRGVAEADKALIVDGNKDIAQINTLFANKLYTGDSSLTHGQWVGNWPFLNWWTIGPTNASTICFSTASDAQGTYTTPLLNLQCAGVAATAITSTSESINGASLTSHLCVKGSSTYVDGGYRRVMTLRNDDVSPIIFDLQIQAGASTTSTNAVAMGTYTSNDLRFMVNDSTKMTVRSSNGYVGIGLTNPIAPLEVAGSASLSVDPGGLGYGSLSKTTTSFSMGPLSGQSISIRSAAGILVASGSYFTASDRRLKKNIIDIPDAAVDSFMDVSPRMYHFRNQDDKSTKQLGFIAQELLARGLTPLVSVTENESLHEEQPGDPDGYVLGVDYNKICVLLHAELQRLRKRVDQLEKRSRQSPPQSPGRGSKR